jgi:hypothetical protein
MFEGLVCLDLMTAGLSGRVCICSDGLQYGLE